MTETAEKRKRFREADVPEPERLRSLLVPVDLTPSSDRVLGRLSLLPLADDARVALLHVVPGSLPREQRNAERAAHTALAAEARHLRELLPGNVSIEALVKTGAASKEISACSKKFKADLVVMGRGRGRALREAFLGSTAERVIRQAQIPVLVARLAPRMAYSRPALALDFDEAAHDAVRLMLLVLPPPRRRVAVIHAYETPYESPIYHSISEDIAEELKGECELKAAQKLARLLVRALAKAKVPPDAVASWAMHVRSGSPRLVVEKFVRKAETDLLVLGTHGYSGAAYAFLGTVAGNLLRQAKCDVLVVPPAASRR